MYAETRYTKSKYQTPKAKITILNLQLPLPLYTYTL